MWDGKWIYVCLMEKLGASVLWLADPAFSVPVLLLVEGSKSLKTLWCCGVLSVEGDNFLKKLCCFVVLLFEVDNFLKCGVLLVEGYKFLKKPCCCVVLLFEVDNFFKKLWCYIGRRV